MITTFKFRALSVRRAWSLRPSHGSPCCKSQQAQQLEAIRLHHDQEVEHHVEQIKAHQVGGGGARGRVDPLSEQGLGRDG